MHSKMIVVKPFRYGGKMRKVTEQITMRRQDAKTMKALGKVVDVTNVAVRKAMTPGSGPHVRRDITEQDLMNRAAAIETAKKAEEEKAKAEAETAAKKAQQEKDEAARVEEREKAKAKAASEEQRSNKKSK